MNMKKIIFFVLTVVCALTACTDKNAYTLTGTFATKDQDGTIVYLQQLDSLFRVHGIIDSVKVENSKFVFKGIAKELPVVQIVTVKYSVEPVEYIVEKGKIEINYDSELKATVKGTALNDKYQQFESARDSMFAKGMSAYQKFEDLKKSGNLTPEQFQEFNESSTQLRDSVSKLCYDFIKPYMATPAGQYFFIDNSFYIKDDQQKDIISSAPSDFINLKYIQNLKKGVESREATSVGKQFTDVKGFNLDGKKVSLSDYAGKGKVVLVDFWASWCGPCVESIPDLVPVYQEYKKKGLEIVGISLDERKEDWKKAVKDLNITWPQISNLKGWNEDCSVAYGVFAIPQTVLIDKDGKIIERNISEDALIFKLKELLGSK